MPIIKIKIFSGILAMAFAFLSSLLRIRKKEASLRFLSFFLGATLATELLATWFNYRYHNNMPVYQLMGPVVMTGSALYFNYSNPGLERRHIGYLVAASGFILTACNLLFFEHLNTLNTNFALFECVCMSGFALYFLYTLYTTDRIMTFPRNPHFWIAFLFLVFYMCTFLSWAAVEVLRKIAADKSIVFKVYNIVFELCLFFYCGIGIVLLIFKPKQMHAE